MRLPSKKRITRNATEAMVAGSSAIAVLFLTTVSLGVYIEYSGLLTWAFVGSAIAVFVYQLGRYMQVVGLRTVRIDIRTVWRRAPRAWRTFLVACVAWSATVIAIGDHVALDTPMVRDGRYIATRYGHFVRYISRSEYRDLKMGRFRLFGGVACIFLAFGATVAAARNGVGTSDDSPVEASREPCA